MEPAPYLASCKSRTWEAGALRPAGSERPAPGAPSSDASRDRNAKKAKQTHPPPPQSPVCRMSEHCSGESRVPARAGGHADTKLFAYVNVGARAPWESLVRFYDTSSQVQDLRGSQARAVFASCHFGGSRGPDAFVQSARPHGAPPSRRTADTARAGRAQRWAPRSGASAPRPLGLDERLAAGGMSGRRR